MKKKRSEHKEASIVKTNLLKLKGKRKRQALAKFDVDDDGTVTAAKFEQYLRRMANIQDTAGCLEYYLATASNDRGKTVNLRLIGMDI